MRFVRRFPPTTKQLIVETARTRAWPDGREPTRPIQSFVAELLLSHVAYVRIT